MRPSSPELYEAVVGAMTAAAADPRFGERLLISGKSKTFRGSRRETWLCGKIAEALRSAGFTCDDDHPMRGGGRVDVAVWDDASRQRLACAIEAKFYFCHVCRRRADGHPDLHNTYWDFCKRAKLTVPRQAIVLAANYTMMPEDGEARHLYQASAIRRTLSGTATPPETSRDSRKTYTPPLGCTVESIRRLFR